MRRSPKPGRLDRDGLERPADLVDHERRERFALDVLGDDRERLAGLHHVLEDGQQVADVRDLLVRDQDERVLEDRFHAVGVGDEVRRDVALVEAHALDELELHAEGLRLLDGDDAVLADLVHRLGDEVADLGVGRGVGGDVRDLVLRVDLTRLLADPLDGRFDGRLDALAQRHRVRAGGEVLQALTHHRPREDGRRRRAVTGDVVGLLRDLLDELGADLLLRVLELDLLGDGDAVVGDRRGAPLLLQDDVASLRAERDAYGVGQLVHAVLEGPPGLGGVRDDLRSHTYSSLRAF